MISALTLGITIVPDQPGHEVTNKRMVENNHTAAKAARSPGVLSNFESLSSARSKGAVGTDLRTAAPAQPGL